ncbi:NADP-dependent oxidoreductase [Pseudonocardia sp. C8]|uniref:NADP-dependent oxidoreductase n=1 Tax=Pseudonocardia sp. C8 TaxID=2762759 RepID=UPI002106F215|nr:NADP-dependent oxidoreductase [Pseudonocardia sp. C8]
MTDLTLEEMEALLHKHEEYELNYDFDGTISTLTANPHYELPTLGWKIDGREAVTELYRRMLPGGLKQAMWAEKRVHAVGPNTLAREAFVMFNSPDGRRVTGQYMAVIAYDPVDKLIIGERLYMDSAFAESMARELGPDFGDIPGVSKIVPDETDPVRVMKAVGVEEFGAPEALEIVELPVPEPGKGEVRIRVKAATVNPVDTATRAGFRGPMTKAAAPGPYVLGMEVAGVLDKIGEGTSTDLEVGDDVMAVVHPVGSAGAYAEYAVVPAASTARTPKGSTYVEATTIPMNGLTARLAIDLLELQAGDTLAVTGAAGAVGAYVVELAKLDGIRVVAVARPSDEPLLTELGADVFVPRGDDFAQRILDAAPGGVDGVVDTAVLDDAVLPAVRDHGAVATLRGFLAPADRGIDFRAVFVPTYAREQAKLDRLRQHVEDGRLTLRVGRTLPAEKAPEAHRLVESGGIRGRVVLEF